jgi:hypothetical protein
MTICILELPPMLKNMVINYLWELGHDVYALLIADLRKSDLQKLAETDVVLAAKSTVSNKLPEVTRKFKQAMIILIKDDGYGLSVDEALKNHVFGYLNHSFSLHDLELLLFRIAERNSKK